MPEILPRISGPRDLKGLGRSQLEQLVQEIRQTIIDTVSRTGGHLAPSLGVVELTVALHKIYDSPDDKIIWDVGHQSYAHKLLTGRADRFHTLRQAGGISGFPKHSESPHDAFDTGHSSTSVSAALGMAHARDLTGGDNHVVAVIGDGALTAGMAFEALNNAGHRGTDVTVVLNDNSMSIAPNVGAIPAHLNRIRSEPAYTRLRDDIDSLLKKIPRIGPSVSKTVDRVKDSLKYLVLEGMLFEELGFTYLGPIDGHDLRELCAVLRRAKNLKGPVLIHAVTVKGRGYEPAEDNPCSFHGTGPFDPETGRVVSSGGPPSYSSVFGQALTRAADSDPRIVAITAAMLDGTGLRPFHEAHRQRCFDVGIAEQHAVTFAAGLAAEGVKPVVAVYSTFLQRAYDQVAHDVCLQNLPVVLALDRAGLVGEDGETHHGLFDIAYLRHLPQMTVMAPSDRREMERLLLTALACRGPAAIRYPRGGAVETLDEEAGSGPVPIGQARLLRSGADVALVALGSMVQLALETASILESHGVEAAVLDARFAKPLDEESILRLARQCDVVVTLEEGVLAGGFGSAVSEFLGSAMEAVPPVRRLGVPDRFLSHGPRHKILEEMGLDGPGVAQAVLSEMSAIRTSRARAMGRRR